MPRRFQFSLSSLFLTTFVVGVVILICQQFGSGVFPFIAGAVSAWGGARFDISRGRVTLAHGAFSGIFIGALSFYHAAAAVRNWQPELGVCGPNHDLSPQEMIDAAEHGAALGLLVTAFVTAKRMSSEKSGSHAESGNEETSHPAQETIARRRFT